MTLKRKLIEVALPLEAINKEAAREKSIRHGHPSTLHLWWARRPLAACRAVLFSSLVDDPSSHPDQFPTEEAQEKERERLFRIIEELVKWENSTNEEVLGKARAEILESTGGNPPPVLDPFCGGGSIPLEAQRLGLEAHASDLNPVAVLITKALIEIPPKFAGLPPVNPESRKKLDHSRTWHGAQGLAEDVRYYGRWMRDEAEKRTGHLYPKVKLPKEEGGGEATVIAWLWARTVNCPNPACAAQMPLVRSFALSTKKGRETWLKPVIDRGRRKIRFRVTTGGAIPVASLNGTAETNKDGRKVKATFRCVVCNEGVASGEYIHQQASTVGLGVLGLAVVAEGVRSRFYLPFSEEHLTIATKTAAAAAGEPSVREWTPTEPCRGTFASNAQGRTYGFRTFGDYFTARQLVALTTFTRLVGMARERVQSDARAAGLPDDGRRLADAGAGSAAYADAVAVYLGCATSKLADYNSALVVWSQTRDQAKTTFARQALPMVWDFAEVNPLAGAAGDPTVSSHGIAETLDALVPTGKTARVEQRDVTLAQSPAGMILSTDPPYYDNISYADLSDFFYVWLRRSVGRIYPDVCSTLLVPKAQELVATPHRFDGDQEKADRFFEEGLGKAFARMRSVQDGAFPLTMFYAFKQAESAEAEDDEVSGSTVASTGWETMLEALLRSGFLIVGTWPMRTERGARSVSIGTNALASSVVLVARPRDESAPLATRKEFLAALKRELPQALKHLQRGSIAPVDLAQAAIGPGMAVFSRYSKVVEADGSRMPVRTALGIINQVLDEVLAEQESEFDADTRWALAWFEQFGMNEGPYGDAETLSKAKDTSVDGLRRDGLLESKRGKVQLVSRDQLPSDWNPAADSRLTVWELTQHLIRRLDAGGESAAAELLRQVGTLGDVARDLAYRLYSLCERKGWAQEAIAYNGLVTAWPELTRLASQAVPSGPGQRDLFGT